MNIGFIGVGNMGGAILKGLLHAETSLSGNRFYICGHDAEKTRKTAQELNVIPCETIGSLVECSALFFIGVKPGKFAEVLPQIKDALTEDKLCISMAAGVTIAQMETVLGNDRKIIRIMPNTPAKVGEIMASVSRNKRVSDDEIGEIVKMFCLMGKAEEVAESLIHAVIGVSGSSPAYTYMYIDALAKAAEKNGINYDQARVFAAQAVLGAAKMVLSEETDLMTLVDNVCSPGGTTIEAVETLKKQGFQEIVEQAAQAAVDKSICMSGMDK